MSLRLYNQEHKIYIIDFTLQNTFYIPYCTNLKYIIEICISEYTIQNTKDVS